MLVAPTFHGAESDLIPVADGNVDSLCFLEEKSMRQITVSFSKKDGVKATS